MSTVSITLTAAEDAALAATAAQDAPKLTAAQYLDARVHALLQSFVDAEVTNRAQDVALRFRQGTEAERRLIAAQAAKVVTP